MKPIFNKETGKFNVFAFGENHEFNEKVDADKYCADTTDWYFSDPILDF